MERSIVFSPDTDDRQLDKEVSKIDDKLGEVDETITPQVDTTAMDGVGTGVSDDGGGGMGMGNATGGGAVAGLASKIPKPIGAVAAGVAIPTAMVGSIGVGMLSAMQSASSRMQTSASLLGQAWNNVWRPIGDKVDQLFIRDVAMDILGATEHFEETLRAGDWAEGFAGLGADLQGVIADEMGPLGRINRDWQIVLNHLESFFASNQSVTEVIKSMMPDFNWPDLPSFSWPSLPNFQWPDIPTPDVSFDVGTSIDITGSVEDLLDGKLSVGAIVDSAQAELQSPSSGQTPQDTLRERERSGDSNPFTPGMAVGGRVEQTGVARVHKGEMVGDRDKLVSELADAIGEAGGGGGSKGAEVDTSRVESKLDRLHRDLQHLGQALDGLEFTVDGETLGRAASNGQQNRVADRNPLV